MNKVLTPAQLSTLKADIAANNNTVTFSGSPTAIKNVPLSNPDGAAAVAAWYNLPCAVDFFGNYSTVPLGDVKNAILYKNFTPKDAVPTTDLLAVTLHMARATYAMSFAMNVNNLLVANSGTVDATQPNIVQALKDTLNADMPTDTGGATLKGGWSAVQKILCRKGTNLEKLYADISGGDGSGNTAAATFKLEGAVDYQTVQATQSAA